MILEKKVKKRLYQLSLLLVSSLNHANSDILASFPKMIQASPVLDLMFRVYNYGILTVLLAVASGSFLYAAAVATSDGKGLARKINAWVAVRTLGGAALLIPINPSGYSGMQNVVFFILKQSAVLVTYVLTGLLTAMQGNDLPGPPSGSGDTTSNFNSMVASAVCMNAYTNDQNVSVVYDMATKTKPGTFYYQLENGTAPCGKLSLNVGVAYSDSKAAFMKSIMTDVLSKTKSMLNKQEDFYSDKIKTKLENISKVAEDTGTTWTEKDLQYMLNVLIGEISAKNINDIIRNKAKFSSNYENFYKNLVQPIQPKLEDTGPKNIEDLMTNIDSIISKSIKMTMSASNRQYFALALSGMQKAVTPTATVQDKNKTLEELIPIYQKRIRRYFVMQMASKVSEGQLTANCAANNSCWSEKAQPPSEMAVSDSMTVAQNIAKGVYNNVGIPSNSKQSVSSVNINVVQNHINTMLKSVLELVTGCNGSSCSSPGVMTYNASATSADMSTFVSPVQYLTKMGTGVMQAGIFYTNQINSNDGLFGQASDLTKYVQDSSTAIMTVAMVAAAVGDIPLPALGKLHGVKIAAYGALNSGIDALHYVTQIDAARMQQWEPLGSTVSRICMIWGVFFGIFLPAVPMIMILFSFIGWIFLAIEAIIATPIIALGLAHPNSQQFFGSSESAVGMFLMLYLRPTLIAVGFVIANILAYAALLFLNLGIIVLLSEAASLISVTASPNAGQIAIFFALILVYTYVVFMVIIQSYSFVGSLPDKAGMWVGQGPMGGSSPLQQVLSMRRGIEQVAAPLAGGVAGVGGRARGFQIPRAQKHSADRVAKMRMKGESKKKDKEIEDKIHKQLGKDSIDAKKMVREFRWTRNRVFNPSGLRRQQKINKFLNDGRMSRLGIKGKYQANDEEGLQSVMDEHGGKGIAASEVARRVAAKNFAGSFAAFQFQSVYGEHNKDGKYDGRLMKFLGRPVQYVVYAVPKATIGVLTSGVGLTLKTALRAPGYLADGLDAGARYIINRGQTGVNTPIARGERRWRGIFGIKDSDG